MNGARGFGVGLLIGAAVGAVIGLLYAPRTGGETRAMLRERMMRARQKGEEVVQAAKSRFGHGGDTGSETYGEQPQP